MNPNRWAVVGLLSAVSVMGSAPFALGGLAATAQESIPVVSMENKNPKVHRFYSSDDGVAIDGTDPVSYFRQGKPVPGLTNLTHSWGGVTWRFANPENRELFATNPESFVPQYGGFCAWAVSQGYTAPTEPDAWRIVGGKLYLNFDRKVQQRWEKDIPGHIQKANTNWPSLLNK